MCCEAEQLMEHCSADAVTKIKERSTAPCTEAGHWADPLSANNVCSQRVRVCVFGVPMFPLRSVEMVHGSSMLVR